VGGGRSRRSLVAAVATVVVLGSGLIVRTPPAIADGAVRVMQYNVCGAICNKGVVSKAGNDNDVVDDIRNRIVAARPHLVMLHEVCIGQFRRLQGLLKGGAWKMGGAFRAQRSDGRCKGGFGDAVLTAGRVGRTEVVQLPDHGSEDRAVLCLNTDAQGAVLACSLHLVTGKNKGRGERLAQLATVARAFNARAGHRAVIVAGDFNTTPGGMGALIEPARGGRFFDVDPQKAATRGTKIDYVLFDRNHFSSPSGGPSSSKFSDHRVLTGQARRR
jgi:hypothetical protein